MSTPDLRDAFENELRRVLIQNHLNYPSWYETLTPRAREVIDVILKEDVTPELIQFSQEVVEEDSHTFQFMYILAGGNPSPDVVLTLTNFALRDILQDVRAFRKPQE